MMSVWGGYEESYDEVINIQYKISKIFFDEHQLNISHITRGFNLTWNTMRDVSTRDMFCASNLPNKSQVIVFTLNM